MKICIDEFYRRLMIENHQSRSRVHPTAIMIKDTFSKGIVVSFDTELCSLVINIFGEETLYCLYDIIGIWENFHSNGYNKVGIEGLDWIFRENVKLLRFHWFKMEIGIYKVENGGYFLYYVLYCDNLDFHVEMNYELEMQCCQYIIHGMEEKRYSI